MTHKIEERRIPVPDFQSLKLQGARDDVGRISKRIVLIDGVELSVLMVRNGVGVRTRTVYEVKRVDEDYFSE